MKGFTAVEIDDFDPELLNELKKLEVRNLGREAAVNQWVIPVLIRYGKFIIVRRTGSLRIVGVCQILKSFGNGNLAFIHSFYIDKGFRGKGIGKFLMTETLEILRSRGFDRVELTVNPSNHEAVGLYGSFGFRKAGFRENEYGRGVDRDMMRLEL